MATGTHTIRSNGLKVLKKHMYDWLTLVFLVVFEIILNVIHPYNRYVGRDMMTDIRYPMRANTVPMWSVPIYAALLPIVVFIFYYIRRKNVYDLHNSILGLLYALMITGVLTDAIKIAVGRPRPSFFWRCFPDGIENYDEMGNVLCHGKIAEIREGHKSFPSGHTSWSFAGLGFLSLYLAGKIRVFDRNGHIGKLCLVIAPLLGAALVACSRVSNYWHHWQDVTVGAFIGIVVTILSYRQFFPSPANPKGWGPYAYFTAMEEEEGQQNSGLPKNDVELGKI